MEQKTEKGNVLIPPRYFFDLCKSFSCSAYAAFEKVTFSEKYRAYKTNRPYALDRHTIRPLPLSCILYYTLHMLLMLRYSVKACRVRT